MARRPSPRPNRHDHDANRPSVRPLGGSGEEGVPLSEADIRNQAAHLKERVYATFTGLAIVLVLGSEISHLTAQSALYTLVIGVLGISIAGLAADVISHMAVHGTFPDRAELAQVLRTAGGAFSTVVVPGIMLALAWMSVIELGTALRVGTTVYVVTLAVIGLLAVRNAALSWWLKIAALAGLTLLGVLVVALQLLGHS